MPAYSGTYYIDVRGFDTGRGSYRVAVGEGRGTASNDKIAGTISADAINAGHGDDSVAGGGGDDVIYGGSGRDILVGQSGDDVLVGGRGADELRGGSGQDVFVLERLHDSTPNHHDVIAPGVNGVALGHPGATAGDMIDLSAIDADTDRSSDQAFHFGTSRGIGDLWLVEEGSRTLVRANVDDDARADFELVIADGAVHAGDYTADDFIL